MAQSHVCTSSLTCPGVRGGYYTCSHFSLGPSRRSLPPLPLPLQLSLPLSTTLYYLSPFLLLSIHQCPSAVASHAAPYSTLGCSSQAVLRNDLPPASAHGRFSLLPLPYASLTNSPWQLRSFHRLLSRNIPDKHFDSLGRGSLSCPCGLLCSTRPAPAANALKANWNHYNYDQSLLMLSQSILDNLVSLLPAMARYRKSLMQLSATHRYSELALNDSKYNSFSHEVSLSVAADLALSFVLSHGSRHYMLYAKFRWQLSLAARLLCGLPSRSAIEICYSSPSRLPLH